MSFVGIHLVIRVVFLLLAMGAMFLVQMLLEKICKSKYLQMGIAFMSGMMMYLVLTFGFIML